MDATILPLVLRNCSILQDLWGKDDEKENLLLNGAVLNENTRRRSIEKERRKTNCWKRGKEILGLIIRKGKKRNSTCRSENKLWEKEESEQRRNAKCLGICVRECEKDIELTIGVVG